MNLLLTGSFSYSEEERKSLTALGYTLFDFQQENQKVELSMAEHIDAIVCNSLFLHNDINQFKSLQFIQLTSAGLDRVPIEIIRERKIELYNAKGVYHIPMAEWAVFKVLEYFKCANHFQEAQKRQQWIKERGVRELNGCTVGIIGAGNIGMQTASCFKAFNCKILTADIVKNDSPIVDRSFLMDEIEPFLALCDVVILTMPLNRDTYHYINRQKLELMKPEAILVNMARGAVINQSDLIEALENGTIAYAALDVFEEEPLPEESPLWKLKNVSVTPHNSFVSNGNADRLFQVIYANLKDFSLKKKC